MVERQRPVVVQHSFGSLGTGGPIGALNRLLKTPLAEKYEFVPMHQNSATGGIDIPRIRDWSKMLKSVKPDLVHVRGLGNEGLHGVLAARLAGCPRILVSIHGSVRDLQVSRRLKDRVLADVAEPVTLRLATHVTTVCESMAERAFVQKHANKLVGPITNGVALKERDLSTRRRTRDSLGLADSDIAVISVGRLTWDKGHGVLASALSRVDGASVDNLKLLVVGDGPDADEIKGAYDAYDFNVQFLGRRSDVSELLEASDLFVFPTFHENLSNALLEAMAAGLPVIATDVGGNTEVLRRGGGILIRPKDPDGLATALDELIKDLSRRLELGLESRQVVEDFYSLDAMSKTLDGVYSDILRGASS
jgi:glycosyltransferase involved in cell wall biosynthesis